MACQPECTSPPNCSSVLPECGWNNKTSCNQVPPYCRHCEANNNTSYNKANTFSQLALLCAIWFHHHEQSWVLGGASFSLCPGQITKYGQVKKCIQAHAIWEGKNKMETLLLTWASLDRLIILSVFCFLLYLKTKAMYLKLSLCGTISDI